MTWPPMIVLRLMQAMSACCEAGAFYLLTMEPRGLMQAVGACCEAGGFTTVGDSAGCGRGPRGGRLRCCWRRGRLWLVGRWADAVDRGVLRDERAVRGLALTSLVLLERSGRSDWTGSHGPVRETREGAWSWHLAY